MRKIQMERKLFELFGHKFLVFENFKDSDLNIDDKSIYKFEDEEELVSIFVKKRFFNIWSDHRRLNSSLICACEGNLSIIVAHLRKIGIKDEAYSTSDCGLRGGPSVLYFASKDTIYEFIQSFASTGISKRVTSTAFLSVLGSINTL